jgi:hypothetical protein
MRLIKARRSALALGRVAHFKLTEAIFLTARCETQAHIDVPPLLPQSAPQIKQAATRQRTIGPRQRSADIAPVREMMVLFCAGAHPM